MIPLALFLQVISVDKIWDQGAHNAFTDLIRYRGKWYCTFREADDHVGGDGRIRVLRSGDAKTWTSAALLSESGTDLRDPKFSITPDNRLMIVAGGSVYGGTKVLKGRQPRVIFSRDGSTWTAPQRVLAEGDWLWRVTWHKGRAYGVSYDISAGAAWQLKLAESDDGVNWHEAKMLDVPNRPNETTLRFLANGDCVALVRREGPETDRKLAWLGVAKAPYHDWIWKPASHQFGGPNFIVLPNGSLIAGGRDYRTAPKNRTSIGHLSLDGGYTPEVTFPSAGDNSYPGFVWHQGMLWVSYYSSHEGKTSVYLAKVRVNPLPAP